jgi:glutamate-5-semialdehyde dehydrogenase
MFDISMDTIGQYAKTAAGVLATSTKDTRTKAILAIADALDVHTPSILKANTDDMHHAKKAGKDAAFLDRLYLDDKRVHTLKKTVIEIAHLKDPVGVILETWDRPNGLHIQKVSVPLGVIGIIYESRPNVTIDAACLCIRSGNAAILRSGSDSLKTALALHQAIQDGLKATGLLDTTIQLIRTKDRIAVDQLLNLDKYIDVIIPRGGKGLISAITKNSTIPVIKHLDGICHVYIDKDASLAKSIPVVLNSKMRRTGVCGAAETLLIHRDVLHTVGYPVLNALLEHGCSIKGDAVVKALDTRITPATDIDWDTEYLAPMIAVKTVESVEEAVHHINHHGSNHTDSILTEHDATAQYFLSHINSALALHNTSTQFADGGEFGFGAEIGIATGKLHVRGPVGAQHLVTMQYRVNSHGAIRP